MIAEIVVFIVDAFTAVINSLDNMKVFGTGLNAVSVLDLITVFMVFMVILGVLGGIMRHNGNS